MRLGLIDLFVGPMADWEVFGLHRYPIAYPCFEYSSFLRFFFFYKSSILEILWRNSKPIKQLQRDLMKLWYLFLLTHYNSFFIYFEKPFICFMDDRLVSFVLRSLCCMCKTGTLVAFHLMADLFCCRENNVHQQSACLVLHVFWRGRFVKKK